MRWGRLLLATGIALIAHAATAESAAPPDQIQARYALLKNGIEVATITDLYARDTDHYTLTSMATPLGLVALFRPGKITIHSTGMVTAQGLQPQEFSYQYEADQHKNSDAKFLWESHQLKLDHDGTHTRLDLPRGTQDRLSAMYQFIFLPLHDAQNLVFPMTNGSKLDHYQYTVSRGSPCNSSAGQFDTWYLDSEAKKGETRTQIWLAITRHNLPCKIIVTDPDGGQLSQELRSLETQP